MSTLALRAWQQRFAAALRAHPGEDFLLVACPAAGKTLAAGAAVADAMATRDCEQLVVVCPTVVVRDQWASELRKLGYKMTTRLRGPNGWPESTHGICATYAQVAHHANTYAAACERRGTVVICDEIHHAGAKQAWGRGLRVAFAPAKLRLTLSGTPFRSDRDRIPFVRYGRDAMCLPDFAYSYPQAVRDGVCRRVEFRAHNGEITWLEHDGEPRTANFRQPLEAAAQPRRLRASLDPGKPYLAALLEAAHEDLIRLRRRTPDAGGLVICDTQNHAFQVDALLTRLTGSVPILATSDIPGAHQAIREFGEHDDAWLVSVRMVAEGVDIPRLGVIAWATAARTELLVRQVAGRALRGGSRDGALPAIIHMPADPQLVKYAERIAETGGVSLDQAGDDHATQAGAGSGAPRRSLHPAAVDAQPAAKGPSAIAPAFPAPRVRAAARPIEVTPPALPPSPEEIAAAQLARETALAEIYRLTCIYAQLRRSVTPTYQLASAQAELVDVLGVARQADASDEQLEAGRAWLRGELAALARRHPDHVQQLARTRRRLAAA